MQRISFILPAFNEEALLPRAISSLQTASETLLKHGWESEIIVCDNNSSDDTAKVARKLGAIVVHEPINQISRARNCGAKVASGDWFVFLDADSALPINLARRLVSEAQATDLIALGAAIHADRPHFAFSIGLETWNLVSKTFKLPAGSFFAIRSDAFKEVGGFPEDMFAGEELELGRRLHRYGRTHGGKVRISYEDRVLTSSRKAFTHSPFVVFKLLALTLFTGGRSLRNRDNCDLWYKR